MTLSILICTMDEGILTVPQVLLTERADVNYIISFQYTDKHFLSKVPELLVQRKDVFIYPLFGKGLSVNRNNAIKHAIGDLALIADDDVRYKDEYIDNILQTFQQNPCVDIAVFRAKTYKGDFLKKYQEVSYDYANRPKKAYVSSVEIAFRIEKISGHLFFNECFGLGSDFLACGEEDIFLEDALRQGLRIQYYPLTIVETEEMTTGTRVYKDVKVLRSKGAVLYYIYGNTAWLRAFKFALLSACRGKGNILYIMRVLIEGIVYIKKKCNE